MRMDDFEFRIPAKECPGWFTPSALEGSAQRRNTTTGITDEQRSCVWELFITYITSVGFEATPVPTSATCRRLGGISDDASAVAMRRPSFFHVQDKRAAFLLHRPVAGGKRPTQKTKKLDDS